MFYVIEPQADANKDRNGRGYYNHYETNYLPCAVADAEIYAVFTRENYTDDPEYLGDISISAMRQLLTRAK